MKEITLDQACEIINGGSIVVLDRYFELPVYFTEDMGNNPYLSCYCEQTDDSYTRITPDEMKACKWFIDDNIIIARINEDKVLWHGRVYKSIRCEELLDK